MGEELEWPIRGWEAVEAGVLSVRELRRFYVPVYPGVHVPRGAEPSAVQRSQAAWLWSRRRGVIAGLSAAAMLGAKWIEPGLPAELIHTNRRQPPMLVVHSDDVAAEEIQRVEGICVTTAARTAFDIGRRMGLETGVQRIDALMNATDVKVSDIESVAALHPGVRGLTQLGRTLKLVDGGAESPYESLTRLMFVQAGFPPPETQIPVLDEHGVVIAVIDIGWREYLVGVDFGRRPSLDRSQAATLGLRALHAVARARLDRFQGDERHGAPAPRAILNRVGAALVARGCPKTW